MGSGSRTDQVPAKFPFLVTEHVLVWQTVLLAYLAIFFPFCYRSQVQQFPSSAGRRDPSGQQKNQRIGVVVDKRPAACQTCWFPLGIDLGQLFPALPASKTSGTRASSCVHPYVPYPELAGDSLWGDLGSSSKCFVSASH